MSPEREQAEMLLRKASEDVSVLEALIGSSEIADAPLGFHAQQAVEKALKAVLAARGVDYPRTHDIQTLLLLLNESDGDPVPDHVAEARKLAPWAVEFRYGEVIEEPLDRKRALSQAQQVIAWARLQLTS